MRGKKDDDEQILHLKSEFWQRGLDRYEASVCPLADREGSSKTICIMNFMTLRRFCFKMLQLPPPPDLLMDKYFKQLAKSS